MCVFMGGRGRKAHSKVHFCVFALCLCLCTLGSIKQVAAYGLQPDPSRLPGPLLPHNVFKLLSSDSQWPSHIYFKTKSSSCFNPSGRSSGFVQIAPTVVALIWEACLLVCPQCFP